MMDLLNALVALLNFVFVPAMSYGASWRSARLA